MPCHRSSRLRIMKVKHSFRVSGVAQPNLMNDIDSDSIPGKSMTFLFSSSWLPLGIHISLSMLSRRVKLIC